MARRLADVAATRAVVGLLASYVSVVAVTGCNSEALSRRELVVHFDVAATSAQHRQARAACSGVAPHTSPEPIVHNDYPSSRVNDVRFRIDHANDHDIARLQTCLSRQPGVVGTEDTAGYTS
jgi:hypothetical protein